ncbi:MAG: 3-dehydroquinate synthase [Pelagibacteraceae bacterium TMED237]|nr:MAG: 3-dehydroquinate synthase [Pelagibacteraceae bacterium TMED237]
MKKILKYKFKNITSNIIIESNYISKYLNNLSKKNTKIFCIVDLKVKYVVKNIINKKNFEFIFLNSNENIKNINSYYKICEKLLSKNIDRNSIIIVIGGGTIGDLGGFIASTILRGIDFILIPTTLLSQVDSSIGGKNGINSVYGKNLIGTFNHPKEVIIDTNVLKTLPLREIKSGYAEILKHSLIKDRKFFEWLEKNYIKLFNLDDKVLRTAIEKSILIKLWFVKKDIYEKLIDDNSRAMLNFGHTFGHSLETYYKYNKRINHGEAISIGMIIEGYISNKLGFLTNKNFDKILNHFKNAKLRTTDKNINNKAVLNIILKDKKNLNGKFNIILLKNIGKSFFARNLNFNKIKNIVEKI